MDKQHHVSKLVLKDSRSAKNDETIDMAYARVCYGAVATGNVIIPRHLLHSINGHSGLSVMYVERTFKALMIM